MTDLATPVRPGVPASAPAAASGQGEGLMAQWEALHRAAALVAGLAGRGAAGADLARETCPESLAHAPHWRRALVGQGLADTAAILEGGIRALLTARAAGAPIAPAAEALWQEFLLAREGIATLGLAG